MLSFISCEKKSAGTLQKKVVVFQKRKKPQ